MILKPAFSIRRKALARRTAYQEIKLAASHPSQSEELLRLNFPNVCGPERNARIVLLKCEAGSRIGIHEKLQVKLKVGMAAIDSKKTFREAANSSEKIDNRKLSHFAVAFRDS